MTPLEIGLKERSFREILDTVTALQESRRRWRAIAIALTLLILGLLATPSLHADTISYTFSTTSGVSGSFTFEDSTPFTITTGFFGTHHFPESQFPTPYVSARSELSQVSGSFGDYTFSGTGYILRLDYQAPYGAASDLGQQDFWFLRSELSSPAVQGRSLTSLYLLDYLHPSADMGSLLLVPPPNTGCFSQLCLSYSAAFSDGTHEDGGLSSLRMAQPTALASFTNVPEPPTWVTMGIGLAILGVLVLRDGKKKRSL